MRILIIEDNDQRIKVFKRELIPNELFIFTDAAPGIEFMKNDSEGIDLLMLDHDLGGTMWADPSGENTGSAVVRWMIANKPKISSIIIHSHNVVEAKNMFTDLSKAGYAVDLMPFRVLNEAWIAERPQNV